MTNIANMVYILFCLVLTVLLGIVGEQAVIGILNEADITGLMRIVLLGLVPGALITVWLAFALKFVR